MASPSNSINEKITALRTMVNDNIEKITVSTRNELVKLLNQRDITNDEFLSGLASMLEKLETKKSKVKDIQLITSLLTTCGLQDTLEKLRNEIKTRNPAPHKKKNVGFVEENQEKADEEAASLSLDAQPITAPSKQPQSIPKATLEIDAKSVDKNKYVGHIPEEKYHECMKHKSLETFDDHKGNVEFLSNKKDDVGNKEEHIGKIDILVRGKTTNAEATKIAHAILKTNIISDPTFTVKATDYAAAVALAEQCKKDGIPLSRIIINDIVYEGKAMQEFLTQKPSTLSAPLEQVERGFANPEMPTSTARPVVHSPSKVENFLDLTDMDKVKKEAEDTATPPKPNNPKPNS